MKVKDWKDALGAAFGVPVPTEPAEQSSEPENKGDALAQQGREKVHILLDKRNRKGKKVTLITDLLCDDEALKNLAREIKTHCGVGGSARDGEILIQGDFRQQILTLLKDKGFNAVIN